MLIEPLLLSDTPVKFAICGFGHIGKRHAAMMSRNPEAKLVAVIDTDALQESAADDYDVPFYKSLVEYLASGPLADVLTVATPNNYHASQAIAGLQHGMHTVIEKPMGLKKHDCEEVIHASLQAGRHVFCVMQNRYSPPSAWLKEVISTNILGSIYMVQVNCYWNRDARYYKKGSWKGSNTTDGGTLFTQFSHFIDIMYWLFGDIKNVATRIYDFNHQTLTDFEDSGIVTFDFVRGGAGVVNFSTSVYDQNLESSITIIGEKGSIKVGGQYMNEVEYCHIEGYNMPELAESSPANDYGHYKGSAANHHFVIENVVDTLKGRTSATTNALEGMKVVDIIERMYGSKD
jgi:UDP-N-acetyl-2-amino-2-deoxyglucuronate dehydrogenase